MVNAEREAELYKREGKLAVAGALEAGLFIAAVVNPTMPFVVGAFLVGLETARQAVLFERAAFSLPKEQKPPAPMGK